MRAWISVVACSAAAVAAIPSFAAELLPGQWEIIMETRVAATPGFAPEPFKLTQCFTAEDTRDPARLLGQIANPGASGCTYGDRTYTGDSLSFTMRCSGTFGIVSRGVVTFDANSMSGTIDATANVGGASVETQSKLTGRRIGGC